MHAVLVRVTVQPGHRDEAEQFVHETVIPRVKEAPGLVAGYWFRLGGDKGASVTLWESEQAAQASAEMARNAPTPESVNFDSMEVAEVFAQI